MSRTYRTRKSSFEVTNCMYLNHDVRYSRPGRCWWWFTPYTKEEIKRERGKHTCDGISHWDWHTLPQEYRNMINRQRRAVDKRELHRELNRDEYVGNYDPWNCKTSNQWGYW